ncbi:phosphotransferase family protein [Yinghuangia soli]|uniref:Aminoglycoside phosphotransferase family protein n=1 Tax=Yinghuangia soli TaxID=2908204 RepID=A0AA41Q5U7_9ACTN|nr:phosphotransferase [Yinghuangia soli]MCF2532114.1 aminoglycoside phosphotransferase family protein [Yinghuangia soli]
MTFQVPPPPPPGFHTAPRVPWAELDPAVRSSVQEAVGEVGDTATVWAGFSCDFAAALDTAAGSFFVKGVRCENPSVAQQLVEAAVAPYVTALSPRLVRHIRESRWDVLVFEWVDAVHADLSPGSRDLPCVADALRLLGALAPPGDDVPLAPVADRWSEYLDAAALAMLDGRSLLHTDLNPHNLLSGGGRAYVVDWATAARGPAWVDVAHAALRLMEQGHTAADADAWARQVPCWREVRTAELDALVTAQVRAWSALAAPDDARRCSAPLVALGSATRDR